MFTSARERRLWLVVLAVVATIYATLGLAGALADVLGDSGLDAVTFVLGALLVLAAVVIYGATMRPGGREIFVVVGLAAVYVLLITRLTSPVERSHLMEYGVVAVLVYAALLERRSNGKPVPVPGLLAIGATAIIGTVDELIQWVLPNRVFDPIDIVFNIGAAAMAVAASGLILWVRRRRADAPS